MGDRHAGLSQLDDLLRDHVNKHAPRLPDVTIHTSDLHRQQVSTASIDRRKRRIYDLERDTDNKLVQSVPLLIDTRRPKRFVVNASCLAQ